MIRQVICNNKGKSCNNYLSFVIEPKIKSIGIVVIMIKLENQQTLLCNVKILPFSSLSDIAEPKNVAQLLMVNLEKSKRIMKTDIKIVSSETGEAFYAAITIPNFISYVFVFDRKCILVLYLIKLNCRIFDGCCSFGFNASIS